MRALLYLLGLLLVATPSGASATDEAPVLLVFGDSLSAAYELPAEAGWVALLGAELARRQPAWRVVNASVSGETSSGGRARLPEALARHRPALVVLALGANDGLRGLDPALLASNLSAMVLAARQAGAAVLLVGVRLPPNYGPDYARAFEAVFPEVASSQGVPLLPFLLAPIATDRSAFLADQLHPNAAAQPRLRDHVLAALESLLQTAPTTKGARR